LATLLLNVRETDIEHRCPRPHSKPDLVFEPEPAHERLKRLSAEHNISWVRLLILPLLLLDTVEARRRHHRMVRSVARQVEIPEDATLRVGQKSDQIAVAYR